MKRLILNIFAALVFSVSPTLAWYSVGGEFQGFWVAKPLPTASYVAAAGNATDLTTYTFSAVSMGTVSGARSTIVAIMGGDDLTDFSISTVTICGVTATLGGQSGNAGSLVQTGVYIANTPEGATCDVVVTWSEQVTEAAISVYAAYDLISTTATATTSEFQTSGAIATVSVTTLTNGVVVGSCASDNTTNTATWTGATEQDDLDIGASNGLSYSSAYVVTNVGGSPFAVTCDFTNSADAIATAASFR